ncbi:hypothetical protein [Actinoplanes sp. NPDC051494]|uniref:hypothetical protein n=1 Tax=Actinoplanes sp. NPDC051494 TaxID=3363907 RepID=UPI0037A998BE
MIENTSKRGPLLHLAGSLGGPGRYIEEMESSGQTQLVNSDRLPTRINHGAQADFEAVGFVFGDIDKRDPLFRQVTLPAGWKRQGSDHAMWSYIVDKQGSKRVAIFYKAAFYDRDAFMSLREVA